MWVLKANEDMTLAVAGFPPAERGRFRDGSKVHEASTKAPKTMQDLQAVFTRNAPGKLDITIKGIPTPGLKRTIAVILALLAMAGGIYHLYSRRTRDDAAPDIIEDLEQAQAKLLDELALLEKLLSKGEVGPRTYKSLRTQLLDALARIMARLTAARGAPPEAAAADDAEAAAVDEDAVEVKKRRKKRRKKKKRKKKAPEATVSDPAASAS